MPHKYNVGQLVALGQCQNLVQDVGCRQVALPSLLARLAEKTIHLTPHLTRDAKRGPVVVWNIDRLNEQATLSLSVWRSCEYGKQVLDGAVFRALAVDGRHEPHFVFLFQTLAVLVRDVSHLSYASHVFLIEPLSQLLACKGRHAKSSNHAFQLSRSETYKSFFRIHGCKGTNKNEE